MKAVVCLICFVFFSALSLAQQVLVKVPRDRVLYLGVPNPLMIAATDIETKSIVIECDNGSVLRSGDMFEVVPQHTGKVNFIISERRRTELRRIGTEVLLVNCLEAKVTLLGKMGGQLPATLARRAVALTCPLVNSPIDGMGQVTQTRLRVVRDNIELVNKLIVNNAGVTFTEEDVSNVIRNLTTGDKLTLTEIKYTLPGGKACVMDATDMQFVITGE